MMIIGHLADLHLRLYKRHQEYREVFQRLYDSLKQEKVDRIAIVGDIFHSKNILSPELVDLAVEFFKNLAQIAPVDIVIGNHDLNLKNKSRENSLSAIIDIVNELKEFTQKEIRFQIKIWDKSGIFKIIDNVNYGIFSILDETHFPYIKEKKTDQVYIALFHGVLDGVLNENNFVLHDSYSVDMFDNYDIVMLGDQHKRQFMGNDHIAYCGDLIQQDFAESLSKGYLLWDTDTKKSRFIEIKNDYAFYLLKFNKKLTPSTIPAIQNIVLKPSIRVILSGEDYTLSELKELELGFRERFSPVFLEVKKDVHKSLSTDSMQRVKNASNLDSQIALIQNFLKKDKVDDETIERVLNIHKEIRNLVPEDAILKDSSWKIKRMKFSNIFSYGEDNEIDFEKLKGITGIFSPNAYGKSSILETILYVFFNKTSKTSDVVDIINNQKDFCSAEIEFEVDNNLFRISRNTKRLPKGSRTELNFEEYKEELSQWAPLNEETRPNTDKIIRKYIGTYDDLTVSSFSPQFKTAYFLEAGNDKMFRLELLSRFLGLNIFKEYYNITKKKIDEVESILNVFKKTDYASLVNQYFVEIDRWRETLIELNEEKVSLERDSVIISDDIDNLNSMIEFIPNDFSISLGFDLEKSKEYAKKLELQKQKENDLLFNTDAKLISKKLKLKEYDESLLKEQSTFFEELSKKKNSLTLEMSSKKTTASRDLKQIEILESQPWTKETEVCQKCLFYNNASLLQRQTDEIKSFVSNIEKQYKDVSEDIEENKQYPVKLKELSEIKNDIVSLEREKEIRVLNQDKVNLQIEKVLREIEDYNKQEKEIEVYKKKDKLNQEVRESIVSKKKDLNDVKDKIHNNDSRIMLSNTKITELTTKVEEALKSLEKVHELELTFKDYELYLKCMHREGIPYNVLTSYIDVINEEVDKIIKDFANFKVVFGIDYEKKYIPIDIVYSNGTSSPIELTSGMERVISAIAIRAALTFVSNIPHCSMFWIDESFSQLDNENMSSVDSFLSHLKTLFDNVILISHITTIQDFVDNVISIDKSSGFSRLEINA